MGELAVQFDMLGPDRFSQCYFMENSPRRAISNHMNARTKAPTVNLAPNPSKITEAILVILANAVERGCKVSQYEIVKALFLADKRHLNRYGRPITFDNYYAMKHGPVPTFSYDLLKHQGYAIEKAGGLHWNREQAAGGRHYYYTPDREPNLQIMAPSEVELLKDCLGTVKALGFQEVRKLTHEDPAYLDAWEDSEEENTSYPMSLGMLFDSPNMAVAQELEFYSKHAS